MRPTQPTPQEVAQWIMEAHVDNMVGDMTDGDHASYMADLNLVCNELDAADLRRALGAVVDIAQEFALELADRGVEPDRIMDLVRHGRGRLHVTGGLPADPATVGALPAFELAALIARTDLWTHLIAGCDDDRDLEAFDFDWTEARDAVSGRTRGQLLVVGSYLRGFSERLFQAGAPAAIKASPCLSPDGATCRGHINEWGSAIRAQSKALYESAGSSMDPVWALHHEFFPDAQ
jgi:hypothetical protein